MVVLSKRIVYIFWLLDFRLPTKNRRIRSYVFEEEEEEHSLIGIPMMFVETQGPYDTPFSPPN
jgi:hypothetical protein